MKRLTKKYFDDLVEHRHIADVVNSIWSDSEFGPELRALVAREIPNYVYDNHEKTERNAEIVKRRKSGETYRAIGEDYKICPERVAQIVRRADVKKTPR